MLPGPTSITITVVTGIRGGDESLDLQHEIDLVKTALMYGDHVRLVSYNALAIASVASAHVAPAALQKQLIEKILSERDPKSAYLVEQVRELRRKKGKSKPEMLSLLKGEQLIGQAAEMIGESLGGILGESRLGELIAASDAGVFSLVLMGLDEGQGLDDRFVDRYSTAIQALLTPGAGSFPLFDDEAGSLARALTGEKGLASSEGMRAREVRIAGELLEELPTFADAPMSAVLEAREELAEPLGRFRAAMVEAARTIEEFPGDPAFAGRVEDIWREQVVPALEELSELQRRRRPGALLTKALTSGGLSNAYRAALAVFAATAESVPGLIIAAGFEIADVASTAARELDDVRSAQSANRFLFLYEAERKLR